MSWEENVKINDRIEAAMKVATAKERERCAAICERLADDYGKHGSHATLLRKAAAAIRREPAAAKGEKA